MNAKGISHIEVMLSFLIFMGFIMFAFYFFSPFQASRIIESSLDYTITEIINNATIEIETYSVKIDATGETGEVKIGIPGVDNIKNVRAENKGRVKFDAERVGSSDNIEFIIEEVYESGSPEEGFAIFKFSEDFDTTNIITGGGQLAEDKYSIISSDKVEVISEKRIRGLNASYYLNYEGVKQHFNLPSSINFEFELAFSSSDKIEAKRTRPEDVEIFSEIKRVEILRENGISYFADLIIRIW